jgi:hypothetical protein
MKVTAQNFYFEQNKSTFGTKLSRGWVEDFKESGENWMVHASFDTQEYYGSGFNCYVNVVGGWILGIVYCASCSQSI